MLVESGELERVPGQGDRLINILASTRKPMALAAEDTLSVMQHRRMHVSGRFRRKVGSAPTLLPIHRSFDTSAF